MYELIIKYDEENNKLEISGPIKHPLLCYGMLERAKDVIRDSAKKSAIEVIDENDSAVKDLLKNGPHGGSK